MINQCVLEKHVTWPTVAKGLLISNFVTILVSSMLRHGSQSNLHKSENMHSFNFSMMHWNAFKLGHNIKHNDVNSLLALSVDNMGHVTCCECFIGLSRNLELGGEMPYNRYKLKCCGICLVVACMVLAGMVDSDVKSKTGHVRHILSLSILSRWLRISPFRAKDIYYK